MGASFIRAKDRDLGHGLAGDIGRLDIVIEATGFSPLAFEAMDMVGPNGIVCLSGVSGGSRQQEISVDHLNLEMVLQNKLVFGTVNANRRHFELGVRHLAEIEARWPGLLSRLITRKVPMEEFARALRREPEDVKTIVEVAPLPSAAQQVKEVAK
jgi:threonine dehydrogenase-like Zn-dependent dehydrogenase